MNKLILVNFCTDEYSTTLSDGVVQWDIGTKLKISGLNVSADIVEVHFSLRETNGESKRMLGKVVDGNIIVDIPKLITEAPEQRKPNYDAYAFVYLMNEDSAWTERKIAMVVKSKPKPTDYVSPSELSFLEQLEVAVMNKISIPSYGEVGQVIAVKSVDENGKPIEFEAVNQSGGTGGGETGADGKDGVGIESVEQTTTSTEDGGVNVVTVTKTNGEKSTFEVRNGSKGSTGEKGADGYTPQKGVDYFDGKDGQDGKNGIDGKTAYQYALDGGYAGTEEEFAQKLAEEIGGVEITDGEPTKESTVMTLNPNAEEINIYTAEEIDVMFGTYVTDVAALIGGIEE